MITKRKWFTGFIIGGAIGAAVALLTASRSGEKTRALINEKSIELRDIAMNKVNEAKNLFESTKENVMDETKDRVERLKDVGRNVMQAEAEMIKESKKEAKKALAS